MSITPQSASEANHPDAIRHELDWLLQTKPMWQSTTAQAVPWTANAETVDTDAIASYLATQWAWHGEPRRLGRRFEELLTALIEEHAGLDLLKHSLPIRSGAQTMGELDYVIRYAHQIIHVEVAIKFYAGMTNGRDRTQHHNWVGPSCQDRLDLKIQHLIGHQLPLSQTDGGRHALAALGIATPSEQLGLIYGYLLHPWQEPVVRPSDIHQANPAFWCAHRDYEAAFRALSRPVGTDCGWRHIPRDQWIGPSWRAPELPLIPRRLERPEQADCYAFVRKAPPYREEFRVFVMPDDFERRALHASQSAD